MKIQEAYFCKKDGYLIEKGKPCPVCNGTTVRLLDEKYLIYNDGFPMDLVYNVIDRPKFLSCRNAVVCMSCGEIQHRENKRCLKCKSNKLSFFRNVFQYSEYAKMIKDGELMSIDEIAKKYGIPRSAVLYFKDKYKTILSFISKWS